MAIAPVSGSSVPSQVVRTSMEPIKGVSNSKNNQEAAETIVAQENEENNTMKAGLSNYKFEDMKGVEKVDVNA